MKTVPSYTGEIAWWTGDNGRVRAIGDIEYDKGRRKIKAGTLGAIIGEAYGGDVQVKFENGDITFVSTLELTGLKRDGKKGK